MTAIARGRLAHFKIHGTWRGKGEPPGSELVLDYVAGSLKTISTITGAQSAADPSDFASTSGEPGAAILQRILVPPLPHDLRYGAIRESIASVASTAKIGFQETRAWDSLSDYIIADGSGSCGVVRFGWNGCVAALTCYEPWREFDVSSALARAPEKCRTELAQVCGLPMLAESEHQLGITSIMWSDGGRIEGGESWLTLLTYGGNLLSREMMDDASWTADAPHYWALEKGAAGAIASVAHRRYVQGGRLEVPAQEFELIAPAGTPHRAQALELLRDMGITGEGTG